MSTKTMQGKNIASCANDAYIEVVAGILWRDGHYLATQRPPQKAFSGYWEFPGGKVEEGESLDQALLRELWEELAVGVQEQRYWQTVEHCYPDRRVRVHFFHVIAFHGEPRGTEGQALQWILPKNGHEISFLEADKVLIQELMHLSDDVL